MEFAQILDDLMKERDISAYKIWKDTQIPQSAVGRWRAGKATPSYENVIKLAEYFKVSSDYLLGTEQKEKPADDEVSELKRQLLKVIDEMSEDDLEKWYEHAILLRDAKQSRENR